MHYGHSIKYRYYFIDGIFIIFIQSWEGARQCFFQMYKHFKCINMYKYHILEPTRPRSSVGRALGWYSKGRRFDSHRGQAYFSSLPGVDIHSE